MNMQMQMPEGVVVEELGSPYHARFVLNPLEEGYGTTIGNAFRRVLLSSIQGTAIVGVKISDVQHEFQTVAGVVEDMCEIILNLKEVRLRIVDPKSPNRITFRVKGQKIWTAEMIQEATAGAIEVLDPGKKIATLADDADFDVELRIGRGKGYVPSEDQNTTDFPLGMLPIDAIYTPIKNVIYNVEPFRVGQKTDYERLVLDVSTDGSITVKEAVEHSASILRSHIALFLGVNPTIGSNSEPSEAPAADTEAERERSRVRRILLQPVDELELSVRAHNCLKAASIKTLADLVSLQESDLLKFRNFGRKSLSELADVVVQNGLVFGMNVEGYLRDDEKKND
ncbi:MAG: DNA-directed RNA polymerase subunit alpha [Ignavibacteria bacterium]|nr:DNA-directed RNA polymerase subunit alpha [Ignavibacteria bacterium]MBP6509058.1 DNA-directed RNA polymerase subunit alpha [Candidatus Kapabacteria bacterium]MBK6419377.1 DNA-directed RNA polymerase subunit alpha [Ignavibacteria bacterium]MBK6759992.1 DNA-directed RNA polymerase subunit alpha [Ignavibacteria bacterium]MBK7032811.1 DNA-directed RNA polymerase subunit alpha [Ignavibacteria bacterium]